MTRPDIPENCQTMPWVQSLVSLTQAQAEKIAQLQLRIQELCDEITRLKKMPKRPKTKLRPGEGFSGGKNNKTSSNKDSSSNSHNACAQKTQEEIVVKPTDVPEGSRFKGYAIYSIQELTVTPKDVMYKLEVWQTPDGSTIRALLPKEVEGSHFGSDLRALIHGLYANGMTQPAIFQFIANVGIEISEGQIHNILMGEAKAYEKHSEEILSAGLQEAPYIRVDDTGAKHCHKNSYCTHIGGEYFAYYKTTVSKSRLNFLTLLAQGKEGYVVNDACIWHLFGSGVKDDILNAFELYKGRRYRTKKGMNRLLNTLGLGNKKLRLACLEAGLVGFIQETLLKPGQILLSDRAGQFAILDHAACWVHMERPLRKLLASTPQVEAEIAEIRQAIWSLYAQVKEASISQQGKEKVLEAYDALVDKDVVSPGVREVLNRFRDYRGEMLKALEHPGLPLHNNDSERDIRGMVKFRNVSGSTKSNQGKSFRDGLMTLKQTCYRLGENFWEYMRAWFRRKPIDLAERIRECYRTVSNKLPIPPEVMERQAMP
jgi:Transposase IS66 family